METIIDYLIYDHHRCGNKNSEGNVSYKTEIREVKDNPYYLHVFGDSQKNVTHWELVIDVIWQEYDNVHEEDNQPQLVSDSRLVFKMTSYSKKPTIEEFSEHIKTEMRNVLLALGMDDQYVWDFGTLERKDITPEIVWKFMKLNHKDFSETEKFLRVYDYYVDRIYHDYKWGIEYLMLGSGYMFAMGWDYPIGEHFLAFLDLGKYADYYEKTH